MHEYNKPYLTPLPAGNQKFLSGVENMLHIFTTMQSSTKPCTAMEAVLLLASELLNGFVKISPFTMVVDKDPLAS